LPVDALLHQNERSTFLLGKERSRKASDSAYIINKQPIYIPGNEILFIYLAPK